MYSVGRGTTRVQSMSYLMSEEGGLGGSTSWDEM